MERCASIAIADVDRRPALKQQAHRAAPAGTAHGGEVKRRIITGARRFNARAFAAEDADALSPPKARRNVQRLLELRLADDVDKLRRAL